MSTTTRMRTLLAGITIAGTLAVPLGGIAAATGDGRGGARGVETSRDTAKGGDAAKGSDGTRGKGGRDAGEDRGRSTESRAAACVARVDRRLADLAKLADKVAGAESLTDAHEASITSMLADATTGLTALRAEIVAATAEELAARCERVVTDFRIYALRIPQVKLVLAADALAAKEASFAALRVKLGDEIANADPADGPALAELLATYDRSVAAAIAGAASVADPVLAVTVDDYNADRKVLRPFAATMKDARRDAKTAATSARRIVALASGDDHADDLPGSATARRAKGAEHGS